MNNRNDRSLNDSNPDARYTQTQIIRIIMHTFQLLFPDLRKNAHDPLGDFIYKLIL
jgi:hypothetical protein